MKKTNSILLVDDDKDDQIIFIAALNEIENTTLYDVAENGKEALDKLKNSLFLPDLIFIDINMPVMNGIECLTEIIKNPNLNKIPIVIISSSSPPKDVIHKCGSPTFIKKTSDQITLRINIEQAIYSNTAINNKSNQYFSSPTFRFSQFYKLLLIT
jgi:CheY-like chemotaxis protein